MTETSPVRVFLDSMNAGNIPAALAVLSDELVVCEPEGLLYGGRYVGKQAFLGMFEIVSKHYTVDITRVDLVPAGDDTLAKVEVTYTSVATGRKLPTRALELYSVADGVITGIDVFPLDTRALYDITVG